MSGQDIEEDQEAKTAEPSHKKLEEALEQGKIIYSREVTSFLLILAATILLLWALSPSIQNLVKLLANTIANSWQLEFTPAHISRWIIKISIALLSLIGPIFMASLMISIFSTFIQQGQLVLSAKSLRPDFGRISIIRGFKRLFSLRSVLELLKSIIKVLTIGSTLYLIIKANINDLTLYTNLSVTAILSKMQHIIKYTMIYISFILALIAVLDYVYQRYSYFKVMRMSRKELKEEYKQYEGSPEIKSRMRSMRQQRARQRMIDNVPDATTVITNPEHYAVALKYKPKHIKVPLVVAKGKGYLAQRIKAIATDHQIPIVENAGLAQRLYKEIEVGASIKVEHYRAVAKIINYINLLRRRQ